jgi:hypothetical protein
MIIVNVLHIIVITDFENIYTGQDMTPGLVCRLLPFQTTAKEE